MMKIVLLMVAVFAVMAQGVPTPGSDDSWLPAERRPVFGGFYIPEPICSYKCPMKCYGMGGFSGVCENSRCMCYGSPSGYGFNRFSYGFPFY